MDSLSFRIPEQQALTRNSFDIRPQALQRWVEELPLGDTGEAGRRLFSLLQQTNKSKFSPVLRAEMLGLIAPALDCVFDALLPHYNGLSFPLPQKSVRIALFANHLLGEVVIAHKVIIRAYEEGSWLFRQTHKNLWSQSCHRILVYLNHITANHRIIHRPYPPGVWQLQHELYHQALRNGRQHGKLAWSGTERMRSSIEQEYKRGLLLSLLEPQLFRRHQMAEVHATMPRWLKDTTLHDAAENCREVPAYCVRREEDVPYTIITEHCCEQCDNSILLDLSRLEKRLNEVLQQMGKAGTTKLPGTAFPISRDTLEILRECWHTPRGMRQERLKSDKQVEAAIGMSSIHALMRREIMPPSAHGISDQQMSEGLHPLFEKREEPHAKPARLEILDEVVFGDEFGQNAWAMDTDEMEYRFIPARQINYTETGHCLGFSKKDIESLQVGELIGFREDGSQSLQLCMVRWLKDAGSMVNVGLMRLAFDVEPVLVLLHKGGEEKSDKLAFGCMMGIGDDHLPQLFIPNLPGSQERSLYLAVDGKELPITLGEKVALSPLFEAYHFVAAESLHEPSTSDKLPLWQVNKRLHHIAHSDDVPAPQRHDDFSDVWDAL